MATEDELPNKLEKLEITPNLPQIKFLGCNLPVQLNPFFQVELEDTETDSNIKQKTSTQRKHLSNSRVPYQNCRRCRRASESVLDELKHPLNSVSTDLVECTRSPTNGVLKHTLKKPTSYSGGCATNRKVILREPVLKALQTCLHPHSNVRRKLLATAVNAKVAASKDGPMTTKGISDFRDLIDECHNLLSEDVEFSGRLNLLSLSNRNSKNFTTMQIQNNRLRKTRNTETSTVISLPSPERLLNDDQFNAHAMSSMQPPISSSYNSITVQQRNNVSSPEQLTNPARCSTTCSQQAGNSAAACDDVTIDELACYFETFVHIPKKMSSMAEMMYI